MFSFRPHLFNHEIGIDIGTVNTVIYVKSKGVVINEPTVIAVRNLGRKGQKEIIAFGAAAKKMVGRTPQGITTVRPLSHGVIADFEMTQHMIRHYMSQATASSGLFSHPRVAVCVPASVTEVEKRAVVEVTLAAGAKEAIVVEEPLAAAVGIGLPIDEAQGNMVVNMGGGTCEVAVLSLGGKVINQSVRVAGDALDEAIISMLRQNYTLAIGEITAEEIKIAIGSVIPLEQELKMDVKGRDLVDGLPKVVSICSEEVREAIEPIVTQIEETILSTIELTPPELVRDIVDQGIVLSGGTANLRGLNIRFADALNVPIHIAEQPVYSVALGLGEILEMPQDKNRLSITVE
ncbi:MAG: rod shape-determining protein [Cloacibacillus porcorum]|uniref:rod shape-determining protein n=1 Tax=Cloacibacillus porcorum TaxID=1197717 RepID=UPI0023F2B42B|nr:rod shape-determining protein [Cloacibacillus porcorum]MCD7877179.1 rod shape-determining protein [Cloacibacillus porcorum]